MWWRIWARSRLKSCFLNKLAIVFLAVYLCACYPVSIPENSRQAEYAIYQAAGIENNLIQFIWLEVPEPLESGEADLRIFLARINPL